MRESYFQKLVIKELEENNCTVINNIYNSRAGVSDLTVCYNGIFIAIELKVSKYRPTELQKRFIIKVENSGGIGFVFWYSEDWKVQLWTTINSRLTNIKKT